MTIEQTVCQRSLNSKNHIYDSDFKGNFSGYALASKCKNGIPFYQVGESAQFLSIRTGYLGNNYPNWSSNAVCRLRDQGIGQVDICSFMDLDKSVVIGREN